ncbi:MAG TPA: hypothetical protein VL137_02830 [Polyangiaceae bacterium]|jgi:tetratricopeptide (TPR) repeat protein|nr:hypothetical protein [Polyangiaceae bacterium]
MIHSPTSGPPLGATLLALLLLGGCASTNYGCELYSQGNYIEAEDEFDRAEPNLQQWSLAQRAEYGLYRGLTLLKLGDLVRAQQWLHYSTELQRSAPSSLSDRQKLQLQQGFQQLDEAVRKLAAEPQKPQDNNLEQARLPGDAPSATPPRDNSAPRAP